MHITQVLSPTEKETDAFSNEVSDAQKEQKSRKEKAKKQNTPEVCRYG